MKSCIMTVRKHHIYIYFEYSSTAVTWNSCMLPLFCYHFSFPQSSQCPLVVNSPTRLVVTVHVRLDDDDVTGVTMIAAHVDRSEMCLVKL